MTRRILLVDDDPLILKGMSRALVRAGWAVSIAHNAGDARALLLKQRMDVVVVDYDLGDHTGLDVLEWMQTHLHATVRILMTGHDNLPAIVDSVNRGGVFKVLRKPFQQREVLEVLEGALANAARFVEAHLASADELRHAENEELQRIFDEDAIELAIQVIVQADPPHAPFAYEALMRPKSERYPSPLALLVAAEEHGRVADVGALVLRKAAETLKTLPPGVKLFVNLHPSQLGDPQALEQGLQPMLTDAERVVFEITERSRLQDIECWEESVAVLTQAGFAIAVDDLGAGYSALSMLADLQPQYIKLDMSLIDGIADAPRKQRLVQVLTVFGSATGAQVVAEGVETQAQADCLLECGCDLLQGYLFGRPSTQQA